MATASGLDGVVVAETGLSEVDGEAGRLVFAGHPIEALAGRVGFEEVVALLWDGRLPDPSRRTAIQAALGRARVEAAGLLPALEEALAAPDGMDALRAGIARLAPSGNPVRDAFRLTGAMAVFAAAWIRGRAGHPALTPDAEAPHAADLLHLATGAADPARAAALEAYLVTVADHGLNASTFTARVVASTGSDAVSAVTAALGALKGPLHGGAPGPVLDMLDAVGTPERAAAWLGAELDAGRRIMGMGHRIYRVRDPRAAVLEAAIERLTAAGGGAAPGRLALARAVEHAAERVLRVRHPDRALPANVEFYTAVLLEAVGLPRAAFSPTFAVGRVVGWCAHIAEQRAVGRLVRPASRYVGPRIAAEVASR